MDIGEPIEWRVIGASVRGASHKRNNLPNQDRILFFPESGTGGSIFLAIADGHGGKSYYRSEIGAKLAVETSLEICRDFIQKKYTEEFLKNFNPKRLKETLGRDIVAEWERRVTRDLQNNESSATLEKTIEIIPSKTKRPVDYNERIPYGTTLITVIIQESYIIYIQLGDGDILTVSSDGTVFSPLPRDPRLMGNETTSLCGPHAWDDFFISIVPTEVSCPALILVSTDGYANSYSDDVNFEKTAKDIFEMICSSESGIEDGISAIDRDLPQWLDETSDKGSGDDITVGIICNLAQLEKNCARSDERKSSVNLGSSEIEKSTSGTDKKDHISPKPQSKDGSFDTKQSETSSGKV